MRAGVDLGERIQNVQNVVHVEHAVPAARGEVGAFRRIIGATPIHRWAVREVIEQTHDVIKIRLRAYRRTEARGDVGEQPPRDTKPM